MSASYVHPFLFNDVFSTLQCCVDPGCLDLVPLFSFFFFLRVQKHGHLLCHVSSQWRFVILGIIILLQSTCSHFEISHPLSVDI